MDYVVALLPSIGVGILFIVILRAILKADRRERAAFREFELAEQSASPVAQRDNSESHN
ncbi:hypothetical protein [Georgenia sp. H159]|uniref:hypothetical protein n=1 Tax=Georgenia sp. H159 TaxID=3076115 RepID=UPI002D799854|nr:hypothetical protein [Georgenia sp. H159]